MTVQNPSACFSMSTFGPLQKFTRALAASGALMRISTRPVLSTRGYSAPHTLVSAGLKSLGCCAEQIAATDSSANANPNCFIVYTSCAATHTVRDTESFLHAGGTLYRIPVENEWRSDVRGAARRRLGVARNGVSVKSLAPDMPTARAVR